MAKNSSKAAITFLRKTDQDGGGLEMLTTSPDKKKIFSRKNFRSLIPKSVGQRQEAIIIGAGVAGLSVAYELLTHTDFKVTVLEAQGRIGGRSLTLRPGDSFTENPANKPKTTYTQTCDFSVEDPYNQPYLNAGPGRIPSAHRDVLNYCKILNVDLEVYVMQSRSNVVFAANNFKGKNGKAKAVVDRQLANDPRGYFAQYLYALPQLLKTIERTGTTKEFSEFLKSVKPLILSLKKVKGGEEKYKKWLEYFGNVNDEGVFIKTSRSGYKELPGKTMDGEEENILPPLNFTDLLNSEFWKLGVYQPDDFLWQQTSFQPVGGMDMFVRALASAVQKMGGKIILNAPVQKIDKVGSKYVVSYTKDNRKYSLKAHKCFSNMPIPLLKGKVTKKVFKGKRFWQALNTVMNEEHFLQPTVKVGWQSKRKYWQDPEDKNKVPVFGGISWTSQEMKQMWYPSNDYHQNLGILTGAYNFSNVAKKWGDHTPQWRLDEARKGAADFHGDEFAKQLDDGLSIAWQNIETQRGGWVEWSKIDEHTRDPRLSFMEILNIRKLTAGIKSKVGSAAWCFNELQKGNDGFYIVGDQLSSLPGWQEGAVASAFVAVALCTKIKGFYAQGLHQVPYTAQLVEGRMAR